MALKMFPGEHHADVLGECGESAAPLKHGFPGTPAEMRPLASLLNVSGAERSAGEAAVRSPDASPAQCAGYDEVECQTCLITTSSWPAAD